MNQISARAERWHGHTYQRKVIAKGFRQKYLALFLDPGLGKTSIILQLFKMLRMYGKVRGVLIVAPIRVCHLVWPLEVKKWKNFRHLKVNVMHGPKKRLWGVDADIHIINPDGLPWLLAQLKGKRTDAFPFDMLVVDESTLFKSYDSTRFKNIKKLVPRMKRRYILTGTPIPNGYLQLFSQMQIVDEGFSLGTKIGHYRSEYFKQTGPREFNQWTLRDGQERRISRKIAPFVVRMSADDYLTLPPLTENRIWVDLPPKARKAYDTLQEEMFAVIKGKEVYPPTAASLSQKLHQIANGRLYENWDVEELGKVPPAKDRPQILLHTEKLDALEELLAELNGKPLFVGYWYYHDLQAMQSRFKNLRVLNSKTSTKEAAKIEYEWNAGKIPLLAAHPASVAHGLNFQKAGGHICWYSLIHDFEMYDQFIKRLYRQGATGPISNHFLMARNTIDEHIYQSTVVDKQGRLLGFFDLAKRYYEAQTKHTSAPSFAVG